MTIPQHIIILSDSEDESPPFSPLFGHDEPLPDTPICGPEGMLTDEEEETEIESSEEEEDPEEDPEEEKSVTESTEDPMEEDTPTPAYGPSTSNKPRTLLAARKRVHSPGTIPSTSFACGSRTIRVARKSVHPPQVVLPPVPASPSLPSSSSSLPSSSSSSPSPIPLSASSSPTHTYTPGEPYAPVSSSTAPFYPTHDPYYPIPPVYPPNYPHEFAWYPYPSDSTPHHHAAGASTSAAPPPPPSAHEDPAVSVLIDQAADHEIRLGQLETTVEHMTGTTHYEEIEQNLLSLEDRVHLVEHRAQTSLPERMQILESRLIALERERDVLRARVQALEKNTASTSRAAK